MVAPTYLPTATRIFFFTDTATTEIYTLSLHDALPIYSSINFSVTDTNSSRTSEAALWPNRSEERFSRNAETDLVCRLLLEKKNICTVVPPDGQASRA